MGRHDRITSLADQNREDNISLQRETGRREASATMFQNTKSKR